MSEIQHEGNILKIALMINDCDEMLNNYVGSEEFKDLFNNLRRARDNLWQALEFCKGKEVK